MLDEARYGNSAYKKPGVSGLSLSRVQRDKHGLVVCSMADEIVSYIVVTRDVDKTKASSGNFRVAARPSRKVINGVNAWGVMDVRRDVGDGTE